MTLRSWIYMMIVIFAAYGCMVIIARHYGLIFPTWNEAAYFFIHQLSPWIAMIGGFLFWRRTQKWRIIKNEMMNIDHVSRGHHQLTLPDHSPSSPEIFSKWIMLLGITSLPYYFTIPQPEWISAAFLISIWILKRCFASLGRQT